jgi:hypothetical protein
VEKSTDKVAENSEEENARQQIGLSMVVGFLFMFVVDQLANRASSLRQSHGSVSTLGLVIHAAGIFSV